MGRPSPATQAKRNRERTKQEAQAGKREKRSMRNEQKKERDQSIEQGLDPDLEGIVPGPQPYVDERY